MKTKIPDFAHYNIDEFSYLLPDERIAQFPLAERDMSKLLIYQKGEIKHSLFRKIVNELTDDVCLVFNDTKVVQARLFFQKETGAIIEIFCLEPVFPFRELSLALAAKSPVVWKCLVGNVKKWKNRNLISIVDDCELSAEMIKKNTVCEIRLDWTGDYSLGEVLQKFGKLPLPPYIIRDAGFEDFDRYQTVYSQHSGAIAAPTAGLHVTEKVLENLKQKGIATTQVTLHVGAGTFKPVTTTDIAEHDMHTEEIHITTQTLIDLLHAKKIVAVGTTSMRTLESLYWIAAKIRDKHENPLFLQQWECYQLEKFEHIEDAFNVLLNYVESNQRDDLLAYTQLMIVPGYHFNVCDGLITNFHQPKSTLLMLIAAFIGDDWKKIYHEALNRSYRFLSYGDSSLLWKM